MPTGIYLHKKLPKEHYDKLREMFSGKKRPPFSEEWKKNMGKAKKGKHYPKMSLARMGNKQTLGKHWELSKFTKKGELNRSWKGGISKKIKEYNNKRYKNLSERNKKYLSWIKNKRNRLKHALNLNGSFHTFGEWENLKSQYNFTCPCCGRSEPEIKLTEDHIIPLSKGGSDNIENIQPLCKSCNCKKHTKIIKY